MSQLSSGQVASQFMDMEFLNLVDESKGPPTFKSLYDALLILIKILTEVNRVARNDAHNNNKFMKYWKTLMETESRLKFLLDVFERSQERRKQMKTGFSHQQIEEFKRLFIEFYRMVKTCISSPTGDICDILKFQVRADMPNLFRH